MKLGSCNLCVSHQGNPGEENRSLGPLSLPNYFVAIATVLYFTLQNRVKCDKSQGQSWTPHSIIDTQNHINLVYNLHKFFSLPNSVGINPSMSLLYN